MTPLIAGNWKMNAGGADGVALAQAVAEEAAKDLPACDLLVCPPAVVLAAVAGALARSSVAVGAQDCHAAPSGAHTGDLSAPMLREAGARFVIVGHSERRAGHGESDADVCAKAVAAQRAGLVAIVCIGETEAERDAGKTAAVLARQVAGSIPDAAAAETLVVAYEPVWAIGTGRTPTVDQVAEAHARIRSDLGKKTGEAAAVRILYGGSVKPENARDLLAVENVNGALVGGASLATDSFLAVARAAG